MQAPLDAFRTPDIALRIGGRDFQSSGIFWIDDILIDNSPIPRSIGLLDPTNNGLRLSWAESAADDFERYRIVLSTSPDFTAVTPADLLTFGTSTTVSGRQENRIIDLSSKTLVEMTLTDLVFVNTPYFARIYERDTQGLWNQGSQMSQSRTAFMATPEVGPFTQDFEGSLQWAADQPWTVTEAMSAEEGHSTSHAWEDSPLGSESAFYARNADRWLVARVDLSNVARPLLRFKHRYFFGSGDGGTVGWSLNLTNWTQLATFAQSQTFWGEEEFDLGSLRGQELAFIRFRTFSDDSVERDGWHMDDVSIIDNIGADRATAFPFFDDVENQALSRDKWIAGVWETTTAAAHSGNQVWSKPPVGDVAERFLTLSGPLDLSSVSKAILSFWVLATNSNFQYFVDVSTDGGANWERIVPFTGVSLSNEWFEVQAPLDAFRTPDVVLRIGERDFQSSGIFWVDDISIDSAPSIAGDVDGDGNVDLMDAILILRHVARFIALGGNGAVAADVTGNGTISPLDAALILQRVVGIISSFPVEGGASKVVAAVATLAWSEAAEHELSHLLSLPLILEGNAENVTSMQLTARFDPTVVAVEEVETRLPEDWQVVYRVEDGELRLAMAGLTPVQPGQLGFLVLRVLRPETQPMLRGEAIINENAALTLENILRPLPSTYSLGRNYPNPFNPTTHIQYSLPHAGDARLTIYNLVGQKVRSLLSGVQRAGVHSVEWDGRDDAGERMQSGVYLYSLEAPGFAQTRKMVLVQ